MLSKELQLGRAGEFFACFDILRQGYNAFLSDQGLPFDVLLETPEEDIFRVQVKTTRGLRCHGKEPTPKYNFNLRAGRDSKRRAGSFDICAFVVLDLQKVAYLGRHEVVNSHGRVKSLMQFRDTSTPLPSRVYSSGKVRTWDNGKVFQDHCSLGRIITCLRSHASSANGT